VAVPAAWLGARIMVALDPRGLELFLGFFFIAMIPAWRWFIGTEAMSSLTMFSSKTLVFRYFGTLPPQTIVSGLIVGSSLMAGTYLAKRFYSASTRTPSRA